jgi:hypothetical protein
VRCDILISALMLTQLWFSCFPLIYY